MEVVSSKLHTIPIDSLDVEIDLEQLLLSLDKSQHLILSMFPSQSLNQIQQEVQQEVSNVSTALKIIHEECCELQEWQDLLKQLSTKEVQEGSLRAHLSELEWQKHHNQKLKIRQQLLTDSGLWTPHSIFQFPNIPPLQFSLPQN